MVTVDKGRFNRRRMYLISNEFTLPAFSGVRPLLIAEGFISLKRDLRELNIAEIPVEPRVRSNLIPGRARAGGGLTVLLLTPLSLCPTSPSPPRFTLSATTPRIYLPYPLVTVRACIRSRREWGHWGNESPSLTIFAYSQVLPAICSGRRAAGKRRYCWPRYVKIQPRSLSKTCRRWWCSRSVIQSANGGIPVVVCPAANPIDWSKRILLLERWINCLLYYQQCLTFIYYMKLYFYHRYKISYTTKNDLLKSKNFDTDLKIILCWIIKIIM